MPRIRFTLGVVAAMLFAGAGFLATDEAPDLQYAYTLLGLALAGLTMAVALPRRGDMA